MNAPLILSLAVLLYAVLHSWLASLGAKAWVRQRLGPSAERWYRLAYNLFAGVSGLPILALIALLPDQPLYQIPFPWVLLTSVGQLAGITIIVVGILQTGLWHFVGLRQVVDPQVEADSPLVTTGLYRRMRHPLYTGGLLLIWLAPLMTVNLLIVFMWLTVYLVVGAKLEERRLSQTFGEAYRQYKQRVPMFIPSYRRAK